MRDKKSKNPKYLPSSRGREYHMISAYSESWRALGLISSIRQNTARNVFEDLMIIELEKHTSNSDAMELLAEIKVFTDKNK